MGSMGSLKKQLKDAYKGEELYWRQKSRIQWLREGDKNTKFFHTSVQGRRRRNRLNKLQREDGTWTESEEAVSTEVAKYYRNLLHSSDVGDLTEVLNGIPHTISDELNGNLMKPVLDEEIKSVIFSMNPDKAPGVDGHLLKSVNHTVITLIPKVLNPTSLKHFRPISLCTTMYKVIAKILANRLKCVLHCCICKNQSAFIPGRQILDNIMVSHEYLHYLNNKRHGKDGFMAVKLDMSKAYDRVEWSFLEAIMQKMGFHHKWRTWIMECIRSVLTHSILMGKSKNDSLIFCKANKDQATELMRVLQVYALGSGQLINLDKSSILFSKNVSPHLKHEICQVMGNMQSVTQGKYLGLPIVVARSKQQIFGFVKSNIKQRMSKWNNRFLSLAGKEVMLKSVALAMPTYTMSCFKLPSRVCKDLSSLMSNYWWGEANGKNKIHWCSWRKLTQSKNMGGLGFKDLMAFNAALLGKQVWRLITQPNLLVSQVMKAKYFPSTSIFRCKVPNNASWLWRSLMGARELVNLGTRRKIGNGMNTNIWEDSWIPGNLNGRVTTTRDMDNGLHKVHELICHKTWNTNLVFKIFNPQDAERIVATPISLAGKEDRHFWIYGTDGNYSVSSGYKLQVGHEERKHNRIKKETSTSWEDQTQRLWKDLWKLKVKHKQKIFLWKCLNDALPVRALMFGRTKIGDPICSRCGAEMETIEHTLLNCREAKLIWKLAPVQWEGMMEQHGSFRNWWTSISEARNRPEGWQHISLSVHILWQIWKARNELEFNGKKKEPWKTIQKAHQEWLEMVELDIKETRKSTEETSVLHQQIPQLDSEHGTVEVRIGVTSDMANHGLGIGISLRQGDQGFHRGWAIRARSSGSNLVDEAIALKLAMCKAAAELLTEVLFQVQSPQLLNFICTNRVSDIRLATVVDDIIQLRDLFHMCSFCLVRNDKTQLSSKLSIHALGIILDEELWFP
nr:uncharacterized protein LOC113722690 [Coffea arabica]